MNNTISSVYSDALKVHFLPCILDKILASVARSRSLCSSSIARMKRKGERESLCRRPRRWTICLPVAPLMMGLDVAEQRGAQSSLANVAGTLWLASYQEYFLIKRALLLNSY
jgi:hypothetical protein